MSLKALTQCLLQESCPLLVTLMPSTTATSASRQPPPLVPILHSKRVAPFMCQNTANASKLVFAAGMPSLFHHVFSLPVLHQLLLPFTHCLPPLFAQDSPPPPPPSQPVPWMPGSASQAPSQPLSFDSWCSALKRDLGSKIHWVEAPSNSPCVGSSSDSDDKCPCPTFLADAAVLLSPSSNTPQPLDSDIWQPRTPKDNNSAYNSGYVCPACFRMAVTAPSLLESSPEASGSGE